MRIYHFVVLLSLSSAETFQFFPYLCVVYKDYINYIFTKFEKVKIALISKIIFKWLKYLLKFKKLKYFSKY